jgi:hypothetical protein
MEDTVKTLTYGDTYEYQLGENGSVGSMVYHYPITRESIDWAISEGLFDESGFFRISSKLYGSLDEFDGSD